MMHSDTNETRGFKQGSRFLLVIILGKSRIELIEDYQVAVATLQLCEHTLHVAAQRQRQVATGRYVNVDCEIDEMTKPSQGPIGKAGCDSAKLLHDRLPSYPYTQMQHFPPGRNAA